MIVVMITSAQLPLSHVSPKATDVVEIEMGVNFPGTALRLSLAVAEPVKIG